MVLDDNVLHLLLIKNSPLNGILKIIAKILAFFNTKCYNRFIINLTKQFCVIFLHDPRVSARNEEKGKYYVSKN